MAGKTDRSRRLRQWPWPALAAADVILIGLSLLVFALFDHVIPQKGIPAADAAYVQKQTAADPGGEAPNVAVTGAAPTPEPVGEADFSARFPDKFTGGEVIRTDTTYQSANVNVTVTRYDTVLNKNPVVYYIEDIYIRSIDCFRTVFAKDTFGRSISESVLEMSARTGAVAAVNGDYYAVGTAGVVIRNGVLYRSEFETDEEVLVLYRDGNMKIYHRSEDLNLDQAMAEGAWQAFSFGPGFFDEEGGIQVTVKKGLYTDPRTVLGMVEPGHYMFMVVDGRQDGYSAGMTYDQCSEVLRSLGCTLAYNLDGGRTSQMTFMGEYVNSPYGGGRATSDMLIIVDSDL